MMEVVLTYDVQTSTPGGKARLRQVARACEGYGQRVQWSVFEITCSATDLAKLEAKLGRIVDPSVDSLRLYVLPRGTLAAVRRTGRRLSLSCDDPWIV
jgi:CRISPR-associated protein Cas2